MMRSPAPTGRSSTCAPGSPVRGADPDRTSRCWHHAARPSSQPVGNPSACGRVAGQRRRLALTSAPVGGVHQGGVRRDSGVAGSSTDLAAAAGRWRRGMTELLRDRSPRLALSLPAKLPFALTTQTLVVPGTSAFGPVIAGVAATLATPGTGGPPRPPTWRPTLLPRPDLEVRPRVQGRPEDP